MISHAEIVESIFGYWPDFADGKIHLFSFERTGQTGVVLLSIYYIDSQLSKAATVNLRFTGVTELDLSALSSENVVDVLSISSESAALVTIEGCSGLCGTFRCMTAEVTSVVPNQSVRDFPSTPGE